MFAHSILLDPFVSTGYLVYRTTYSLDCFTHPSGPPSLEYEARVDEVPFSADRVARAVGRGQGARQAPGPSKSDEVGLHTRPKAESAVPYLSSCHGTRRKAAGLSALSRKPNLDKLGACPAPTACP